MDAFDQDYCCAAVKIVEARLSVRPIPCHSRAVGNPVDKQSPRSGSISRFCPLCGVYNSLDSRLRGNDGAIGLSWIIRVEGIL